MSLEAILKDPRFRLPLKKDPKVNFYPYLSGLLDEYIAALEVTPDFLEVYPKIRFMEDEFLAKVKTVATMVKAIFEDPDNAYKNFERLMGGAFNMLYNHDYCEAQIDEGTEFYRCVGSDKLEGKSRFFHAAFELPHFLGPTRFTQIGLPALYLTNCLVAGYLESRTASLDDFQAVKLRNRIRLTMLDLDYTLGDSSDELEGLKQQRMGILYPLYAACFVIYEGTDRNPQEYLLPGFLLQWLRTGRGLTYQGIYYPSTKTASAGFTRRFYNLVMPPRDRLAQGWCPYLKDFVFEMSEVCRWKTHQIEIETYFAANYPALGSINDDVTTIEWPTSSTPQDYADTEPGRMEFFMRYEPDMAVKPIDF